MKKGNAAFAIAELGRLAQTIERLAYVPRKVAVIAAPKISRLLRRQFADGSDPYGRPWASLRPATIAKGRTPPPLTESGRLRDGTKATASPGGRAGIRLVVGARYGYYHQTGYRNAKTGRKVAARRILPQYGLPASWKAALDESAREAVREARRR